MLAVSLKYVKFIINHSFAFDAVIAIMASKHSCSSMSKHTVKGKLVISIILGIIVLVSYIDTLHIGLEWCYLLLMTPEKPPGQPCCETILTMIVISHWSGDSQRSAGLPLVQ